MVREQRGLPGNIRDCAGSGVGAAELPAVGAEVMRCEYVAAGPSRQYSTSLLPCHVVASFLTSMMMRAMTRCLRSCPTYGHEHALHQGVA